MPSISFEPGILSWVLTYALHSSALLVAAWLLTRRLRRGSERFQELVWKTALVGGLVTASLQVGLDLRPLAGRIDVARVERARPTPRHEPPALRHENPAPAPATPEVTVGREEATVARRQVAPPARPARRSVPARAQREETLPHVGATAGLPAREHATSAPVPASAPPVEAREPALAPTTAPVERPAPARRSTAPLGLPSGAPFADWSDALLAVWVAGGALGLLLLVAALKRLGDRLAGRRELTEGALYELFVGLCEHAGLARVPRLCVSTRLDSPATVGVLAPKVCVPKRALSELAPEHQEAMLAHELAHVARRDPQWAFLARVLERALFFQPLNGLARRRLSVLSEYLADEWAVEQTGRGLSLARCLTEVAGWLLERRAQVGVLPMAAPGSLLGDRVRRLLEAEGPARRDRRSRLERALRVSTALAFVGGVAFVLPGAAARASAAPEAEAPDTTPAVDEPEQDQGDRTQVMQSLLDELDGEVDELLAEIEALDATLADSELGDSFAQPVELLRGRLSRLRESKLRLDALAPHVLELLEGEERATPPGDEPD